MAVKIGKALPDPEFGLAGRDPARDRVSAALYDRAVHGPRPRCPGCFCQLKHTRASEQETGSARKKTPAYFGRLPNVSHERGCKYDIEATVKKLVAQSREVREYSDALLAYVSGREGSAEFRLHVLLGDWKQEQMLWSRRDEPQTAKAYQKVDGRLNAYINCVESIMELAEIVADHASLARVIQVVYDGQNIAWEDFFYGSDDHTRLWHERARVAGRPVAVQFERYDEERGADRPYRTGGHYEISGRAAKETIDGQRINIQVKLHVRDRALADVIWSYRKVVVCGLPSFPPPDFGRQQGKRYAPFVHIVLPINHPSQVYGVDGRIQWPQMTLDHRSQHFDDRPPADVNLPTKFPNIPSPTSRVPDRISPSIEADVPLPESGETSDRFIQPPAPERASLAPAPVSFCTESNAAPTSDTPPATDPAISLPPDVLGQFERPATQSPDAVTPAVYGCPAATSPLAEAQSGPDDARLPEVRTVAPQVKIAPDPGHGNRALESAPPRPWCAATAAERPIGPAQRHAAVRRGVLASFTSSCRGFVQSLAQWARNRSWLP